MEKNFPPITEDQVDKIIENFGSYSKSTDDLDLPEADSSSSKNSENDSPAEILNIAATATDNNVVPTENNCNADFSKEEKTNDTQKNFPKSILWQILLDGLSRLDQRDRIEPISKCCHLADNYQHHRL